MAKSPTPPTNQPDKPADTRPPVQTGPGGMAPPPGSLGRELEAAQTDPRPAAQSMTPGGPAAPPFQTQGTPVDKPADQIADGQLVKGSGLPQQPERPDLSTQGQRPTVGGSNPEQTHPDNPAVSGVLENPHDPAETSEEKQLREKREQAEAEGGNVYQVMGTNTLGLVGHVTESDMRASDGRMLADIPHLMKHGVLKPIGQLKADPRRARALGREGQEAIDQIQQRCNELQAENDRLTDEAKKKDQHIRELAAKLEKAHKGE